MCRNRKRAGRSIGPGNSLNDLKALMGRLSFSHQRFGPMHLAAGCACRCWFSSADDARAGFFRMAAHRVLEADLSAGLRASRCPAVPRRSLFVCAF